MESSRTTHPNDGHPAGGYASIPTLPRKVADQPSRNEPVRPPSLCFVQVGWSDERETVYPFNRHAHRSKRHGWQLSRWSAVALRRARMHSLGRRCREVERALSEVESCAVGSSHGDQEARVVGVEWQARCRESSRRPSGERHRDPTLTEPRGRSVAEFASATGGR